MPSTWNEIIFLFCFFFQGDDLLEFHQAVLSTLREEEINQENFAADVARLNELAELSEAHEDDGPEGETGTSYFACFIYSLNTHFLKCSKSCQTHFVQ